MAATETNTETKQKVKEPGKFKVIMLNDSVTTMEFVIAVLTEIFNHSEKDAYDLMMQIHTENSAIVGVYRYEIAEAKAVETTSTARNNGFPLQLRLEEE